MKYILREMTFDDIEEVVKGEEKIFKESLGYDMFYSELRLNPFAYYFVLDIDAKVSGYIGVWIDGEHAEIINFYVDEEYQRNGFGSLMLEFVIQLCELSKVPNISLEVRESNTKAIGLYNKYGFNFSHKRLGYYKDGEDALVLIKELVC